MNKYSFQLLFVCLSLILTLNLSADEKSLQDVRIQITKGRGSIYQLLNHVSEQSGYLLIYDSQLIDNDKIVKVPKGIYTLNEAILRITGNDRISIRILGNHILLYLPEQEKEIKETIPNAVEKTDKTRYFTIEGTLRDHLTSEPIIYGSVGISGNSFGTISNQNGEFKLTLPDSLYNSVIKLSHIGYITREVESSLLAGRHIVFYMDQKVIPLQEVVVRVVDPLPIIKEMMDRRNENYSTDPVYMTAFYREGVEYKHSTNLSEAVFEIYKTGYQDGVNSEQVKLLKMRQISTVDKKDTLAAKFKSSVHACQLLDLPKNPPEFLQPENMSQYSFVHTDITNIDDRRVYVFSFEQNDLITDPLFRGQLFVDAENFALIKARFEINPAYVRKTKNIFIVKRSRNLDVVPQKVVYEVSYKPVNNVYYISHVRGDLEFRVKKKNTLFGSNLHAWFEMVNCKIDTKDVRRFQNNDRISTQDIFSETRFSYDKDFWGNFNVILPEERLMEIIRNYNFGQEK